MWISSRGPIYLTNLLAILGTLRVTECTRNNNGSRHLTETRHSEGWVKENYPNPATQAQECGWQEIHRYALCDPDHALERQQAKALDGLLLETYLVTVCPCTVSDACDRDGTGYKIYLALVQQIAANRNIDGTDQKVKERNTQEFAEYLLRTPWSADRCEEDVVIVFSQMDDTIWTAAGLTAQTKLTRNCINEISRQHQHLFDDKKYAEGLEKIILDYRSVFRDEYRCPQEDQTWVAAAGMASLLFILVIVAFMFIITRNYINPRISNSVDKSMPYL